VRVCKKCGVEKPLEDFPKEKTCKEGRKHQCKVCTEARHKANRERNKERYQVYYDFHNKANLSKKTQWNKDNKDRVAEAQRKYRQNNRGKINAKNMARRAKQMNAMPSWANLKYIELFYQLAKEETIRTGREVWVDHIIPLNSPFVCGLHCEDNLQLLFKEDNIRKGNKL
jgi:hypothetical protein